MTAAALLVASLALPAQGQGDDPGAAVRAVLAAKCVECHYDGSTSRKARRAFDGMDDFERVLAAEFDDDRRMVVPGDPGASELWLTVDFGDMPPDDSDVEPLTDAEKEALRAWIAGGAPLPEDGDLRIPVPGAPTETSATEQEEEPQQEEQEESAEAGRSGIQDAGPPPFIDRLESFAARLHPASTHFPIGLLLAAALARILGWSGSRPRLRAAEGYCLLLGALGAAAAAGLGWLSAEHGSHPEDTLYWHRWLSIGVAGAAWLLVLARPFAAAAKAYGWLLLLTAAVLCVSGHFGGELAWGDDGPRLDILFPPAAGTD